MALSVITLESREEGPEPVPIKNINSPCAAAIGQREETQDVRLAE